jgi:periplasmic protein TonB
MTKAIARWALGIAVVTLFGQVVARGQVGGAIRPPARLTYVEPAMPQIAQAAAVQGVVILEIVIGRDGHVTGAKVLRPVPLLDQSALDAVRQWTFMPTLLNGVPVEVIMTITVSFPPR